jgi:hypothetical protein
MHVDYSPRTDTGIGMTKEQLEENLGTIARSGTSEFLETIESKNAEGANLIGQVRYPDTSRRQQRLESYSGHD